MDRHIIILTTDKRQEALGDLFSGKKVRCSWEEYHREEICEKIYILPTPVSKIAKNKEIKKKLKEELTNCKGPLQVFAGALDEEWREFLEKNGIVYRDFMKLPEVVEGNACITAEATLAEVLKYGRYSVKGQKVLVTGYGCCGKKIATVFSSLGAEVLVAARRPEVRKQISGDGYESVDFSALREAVKSVDTVINTVPAQVITEEIIKNMKKDVLVIDIASNPGGTDFDAAQKYEVEAHLSLGLPGIYMTTSSAMILKDAVSKYAPRQKEVREDREWIFQIII